MLHDPTIYRCPTCRRGGLTAQGAVALLCAVPECGQSLPIVQGILDTLVDPDPEVVREIQGMAAESLAPEAWRDFKITTHADLPTLEESAASAEHSVSHYHTQILANFEQALGHLGRLDGRRVLEIGADYDYHFLRRFQERGASTLALNLHFRRPKGEVDDWPVRVLGDMNNLPFQDDSFDVVLLSATSHHSPDLDKTVAEVARVLTAGGRALFLNDPIGGLLKRLGGPTHMHGRNELVHENEYPIWHYHAAFHRHGLRPTYLFSAFYDEKLASARIQPTARFATLSKYLARAWRVPAVRKLARTKLLWPAHALFGFPLNAIVEKAATRGVPAR